MINYVNNSFDKVLKPCDAQQFMALTQSEQTERLILDHRAGMKNCKAKLAAITYMGVLDEDKYRAYLRQCEEQGGKPLGSRRAEFMRPTGLLMLDFDHVGDARALFATLSASPLMERLALAHVTPSGDGLRLVVQRTMDMTIEQEQHDICKAHDLTFDAVCKDISRLSFVPMHSEVLHYNPSLLFAPLPDAKDYPDGSIFGGALAAPSQSEEAVPVVPSKEGEYDTQFDGVSYSDIVLRLEEQLGGAPEHGARNSFIFTMACNLRSEHTSTDWSSPTGMGATTNLPS